MKSALHYLSHAWRYDFNVCEVYVSVGVGRPPHAGDTVFVEFGQDQVPLKISEARWQDERDGGVLVLYVESDQRPVVDRLYIGVSMRSR